MSQLSVQARAIFVDAVENVPPERWREYLDKACGADKGLKDKVQRLLDAQGVVGSFMEKPAAAPIAAIGLPISEKLGNQIGRYKLRELIGEGGMGEVYVAEQSEPVRRKVALKIIRPGMATKDVIARFEAERQALAMMDHPHIAKVLDGGMTDTEQPYFVMELVQGPPITEYCNQRRLPTADRLRLFATVCKAVQHAHQRGIIHRDLKPSNILVPRIDGEAVPKVIDFGVAKAVGRKLTERTVYTHFSQLVGTPTYMSPEQTELGVVDIDTRSDVYSLGVLLYELLTGSTPFDSETLKKVGFDEMRRMIREDQPPRPSAAVTTLHARILSTVADQRGSDPRRLSETLKGELDWIAMKALEKDRNRRYETASALADDVQRYLSGEPVAACPPSAVYRFRKFARRHKAALAAGAGILTCAAILGVFFGWLLRDQAARRAVQLAEARQALREVERLEEQARWDDAILIIKHAQSLLKKSDAPRELSTAVQQRYNDLDLLLNVEQIRLRQAATDLDANRFKTENAFAEYAQAFAAAGIVLAETEPEQVALRLNDCSQSVRTGLIAALYNWYHRRSPPTRERESERAWIKQVLRRVDRDPWRIQVFEALDAGDVAALNPLIEEHEVGRQPAAFFTIVADTLIAGGSAARARELLLHARREHPDDFWINYMLGSACEAVGDLDNAVVYYSAAVSVHKSPLAYSALGSVQRRTGDARAAVGTYQHLLQREPGYAKVHYNLGNTYRDLRRFDEAVAAFERAIRLQPLFPRAHYSLGAARLRQGNLPAALAAYEKAVAQEARHDAFPFQRLGEVRLTYVNEIGWQLATLAGDDAQLSERGRNLADDALAASGNSLEVLLQHGGEMLLAGDMDGYRSACRAALARLSGPQTERTPSIVARLCSLDAASGAEPRRVAELAQQSVDRAHKPEYLHVLALAEYRAARYEESIRHFHASMDTPYLWLPKGLNLMGLSLAHHQHGDDAQAREYFDRARAWLDQNSLDLDSPLHPHDRVAMRLLLREAVAELKNHDGRTKTHAILPGSPAIDSVDPAIQEGAGAVAAYGFEERTTTTSVTDAAGTNNGIPFGGVVFGQSTEEVFGSSATFDGIDDFVQLTEPLTIGNSSNTVEAWVKVPQVGAGNLAEGERVGIILGNFTLQDPLNACWEILADGRMRVWWNHGQVDLRGNQDLRDGRWHHLVWIRDTSFNRFRAYVDGVEEILVPVRDPNTAGSDITFISPPRIGADLRTTGGVPFFHGSIGELTVYNRALTAAEVAARSTVQPTADQRGIPFKPSE